MTWVYLKRNGRHYTVSCNGHATGSVEVCAAVSCLIYTLAGWLKNSSIKVQEESIKDGEVLIRFHGGQAARAVFDLLSVGFLQLEQQYGDYISADVIN